MVDMDAFQSAGDVWTYIAGLRTGIPPLLLTFELLWWVEFRDQALFSDILYPGSIAIGFTLAVLIQPHRLIALLAVLFLAVPLVVFGVKVHAGNAIVYDPLFGALLLGYFALISYWLRSRSLIVLAAAGLTLSVLELTRPFMIFLLPVFLFVEIHRIRVAAVRPWLALASFLLPVAVLSGGWHVHLYLAHDGQIAWSNIAGYNLQRAWAEFNQDIRDLPQLNFRDTRGNGLWDDLNRPDVYRNSEELKTLILAKIKEEPRRAIGYAMSRMATFADAPTRIYDHDPQGPGISLYRAAVLVLNLLMATYVVAGAIVLLYRRRWPWLTLRWWLGASVLLISFMLAVGEKGEEARFVFSILPALLASAGFAVDGFLRLASGLPAGSTAAVIRTIRNVHSRRPRPAWARGLLLVSGSDLPNPKLGGHR